MHQKKRIRPKVKKNRVNSYISHQKRLLLINLIQNQKISIKKAGQQLGINYSTAKNIIKKYRKKGHITFWRQEKERKSNNCKNQKETEKQEKKQHNNGENMNENSQKIEQIPQNLSQFCWIFIPYQPYNQ